MGKPWRFALLLAAMWGPLAAGAQQADYIAGQRIRSAIADLADVPDPDALRQGAGAIMAGVGLPWAAPGAPAVPARPFASDARAVVEVVDIRLLLTQIAIQTGARDHTTLLRAQGDRDHDVILLRGGLASLEDLVRLAEGSAARDFVRETADGVVLTLPLAIWSDAGLTLDDRDTIVLDRAGGSFIANLGRLDLQGGTIRSTTPVNPSAPAFRPFVMTAGQGNFTARSATFRALGFGDVAVFGGISVANNGLLAPVFASVIADSTFDDVRTVGLIGTTGAVVTGNRIAASGGTAVLVSNAADTVVAANSVTDASGSQAIRITAQASDVQISGNLLSGAARTGILVDQNSRNVTITGNLVTGHLTTGIGVDGTACTTVSGNLVAANGGNGISLTHADFATVASNAVLFNEGAGVLVRDQAAAAQVRVTANVLAGNRSGLRGATVGLATIEGNDLDGQMQRAFSGDFALLAVDRLRDRRDGVAVSVSATAPAPCPVGGEG